MFQNFDRFERYLTLLQIDFNFGHLSYFTNWRDWQYAHVYTNMTVISRALAGTSSVAEVTGTLRSLRENPRGFGSFGYQEGRPPGWAKEPMLTEISLKFQVSRRKIPFDAWQAHSKTLNVSKTVLPFGKDSFVCHVNDYDSFFVNQSRLTFFSWR